jgi:hypothetical protein
VPDGAIGETSGITVTNGKVYVSGWYSRGFPGIGYVPCYWVDGTRVDLPIPPISYSSGIAMGISIYDGKVYVSGQLFTGGGGTSGGTSANRSSSGEEAFNNYCYWVDGTRVDLSLPPGSEMTDPLPGTNITVQGGDVYMTGWYYDKDDIDIYCYWKNGNRIDLSKPNYFLIDDWFPNGITVSNGKVYVFGSYGSNVVNFAGYWVDGTRVNLNTSGRAVATGIAVVTE